MLTRGEWFMLMGLFETTNINDRGTAPTKAAAEAFFDPANDDDVKYLEQIRAEIYIYEIVFGYGDEFS